METIIEKDGQRRSCVNPNQVKRYQAEGWKVIKPVPAKEPKKEG